MSADGDYDFTADLVSSSSSDTSDSDYNALMTLADSKETKKRKALRLTQNADIEADPVFDHLQPGCRTLKPHQVKGVQWIMDSFTGSHEGVEQTNSVILADDMGLGKTHQTFTVMKRMLDEKLVAPDSKFLIVCPGTLMFTWHKESMATFPRNTFHRYVGTDRYKVAPPDSVRIFTITYETLREDFKSIGTDVMDRYANLLKKVNMARNSGTLSDRANWIRENKKTLLARVGRARLSEGEKQRFYVEHLEAQSANAKVEIEKLRKRMPPPFRTKWALIVLDEAHTIRNGCKFDADKTRRHTWTSNADKDNAAVHLVKGKGGKKNKVIRARWGCGGKVNLQFEACCTLTGDYKIAATGTPIQNQTSDIASLCVFLGTAPYNDIDWWKQHGAECYQNDRERTMFRKRMMIRRSEKMIKLPPVKERVRYIDMTRYENNELKLIMSDAADAMKERERLIRERASTKEIRSVEGTILKKLGEARMTCDSVDTLNRDQIPPETSTKFRCIIEQVRVSLRHHTNPKIVISSFYVKCINVLRPLIRKEFPDIEMHEYHGGEATQDEGVALCRNEVQRYRILRDFEENPKCRILFMSLRAGNVGLNLQCANHIILVEPDYNPQMENQMKCRIRRIGQTKPVRIYRFITRATIEVAIEKRQQMKLRKFESHTKDGSAYSMFAEDKKKQKMIAGLTEEELQAVFQENARYSKDHHSKRMRMVERRRKARQAKWDAMSDSDEREKETSYYRNRTTRRSRKDKTNGESSDEWGHPLHDDIPSTSAEDSEFMSESEDEAIVAVEQPRRMPSSESKGSLPCAPRKPNIFEALRRHGMNTMLATMKVGGSGKNQQTQDTQDDVSSGESDYVPASSRTSNETDDSPMIDVSDDEIIIQLGTSKKRAAKADAPKYSPIKRPKPAVIDITGQSSMKSFMVKTQTPKERRELADKAFDKGRPQKTPDQMYREKMVKPDVYISRISMIVSQQTRNDLWAIASRDIAQMVAHVQPSQRLLLRALGKCAKQVNDAKKKIGRAPKAQEIVDHFRTGGFMRSVLTDHAKETAKVIPGIKWDNFKPFQSPPVVAKPAPTPKPRVPGPGYITTKMVNRGQVNGGFITSVPGTTSFGSVKQAKRKVKGHSTSSFLAGL